MVTRREHHLCSLLLCMFEKIQGTSSVLTLELVVTRANDPNALDIAAAAAVLLMIGRGRGTHIWRHNRPGSPEQQLVCSLQYCPVPSVDSMSRRVVERRVRP